jgi:hypothetical protein
VTPIGIAISSTPGVSGLNAGEAYGYQVAAGTFVGCDLCHSLEKSFTGSPGH